MPTSQRAQGHPKNDRVVLIELWLNSCRFDIRQPVCQYDWIFELLEMGSMISFRFQDFFVHLHSSQPNATPFPGNLFRRHFRRCVETFDSPTTTVSIYDCPTSHLPHFFQQHPRLNLVISGSYPRYDLCGFLSEDHQCRKTRAGPGWRYNLRRRILASPCQSKVSEKALFNKLRCLATNIFQRSINPETSQHLFPNTVGSGSGGAGEPCHAHAAYALRA